MHKAIVVFCLFFLTGFLQGQQAAFADDSSLLAEYQKKYLSALTTTDPKVIESVIGFMDQLIAKKDNSVASIYYNKAQLLFRLKRYDEAVETMKQSKMAGSDYYLATLLMRLGRTAEGRDILQKSLEEMKNLFWGGKTDKEEKISLFGTILVYYRLLNKDSTPFVREVTSKKVLSEEDVNKSLSLQRGTENDIEQSSLWPR
jgi:tetratricopeptide (TPR) repeat protein